jgi:uncharacterized protein YjbI with pentapeptide repeats
MTIMNTQFTNQDLSYRAFVNMTLIHDTFTGCILNSTNFTKSTFAQCLFKTCTGVAPIFFQVSMSDSSFNQCSLGNAPWNGSWLHNVVFASTDLSNNSFTDCNLNSVVFYPSTNIVGCVFNDAKIHSSIFVGLDVNNLWFKNVVMDKCNLFGSIFPDMVCCNATLTSCNASTANFSGGNFEGTTFYNCDFTDATLTNCNMFEARLTSCEFTNADLDNVNFNSSVLEKITTTPDTVMTTTSWDDATLYECNFEGINFGETSTFHGASIDSCQFDSADLTNTDFGASNWSTVSLQDAILVNADFSEATITEVTMNDGTAFDNSMFINATLTDFVFEDVMLQSCKFGHAHLTGIQFTSACNLGGVSFADCDMTRVNMTEVNLDGVVFDQAKLFTVDLVGASMIAASFVSATLVDVDMAAAILSADACPMNNDAKVAAKFENATLTRVFITNGAYLRYTVFSGSMLVQCTFFGSSYHFSDYINMSEANFDNVTISDATFQWCNLSYATFNNSKLSRIKFVGCAMDNADVNNVVPEYCTADETTILPNTWKRDSNGWIYLEDPGPVPAEEARNEIVSVAITNDQFRSYQTMDRNAGNGSYELSWFDGTSSTGSHLLKLSTANSFSAGDPVFVQVSQGSNQRDLYYVHAVVQSVDAATCTLVYYTDVNATEVPRVQALTSVFAEFFEYGKQVTVGLFQEKFYRWIKSLDDSGKYATWWDGTMTRVGSLKQMAMVRPILVFVDQPIFVLIKTDSSSMNDDQFLYGSVSADNGNGTFEITYADDESETAPTTQSINNLYTEVV